MYSTTLIIVEALFSGFDGSGERQTSALLSSRISSESPRNPVNSTCSVSERSAASDRMLVDGVAVAGDDRVPVVPSLGEQLERPQGAVDAVLRPDRARIGEEVRAAAPEVWVGLRRAETVEIGCVANDEDVCGSSPSSIDRDAPVALVGGDDDIGEVERTALRHHRGAEHGTRPPAEPNLVELGYEVVVVEDDLRPRRRSRPIARKRTSGGLER